MQGVREEQFQILQYGMVVVLLGCVAFLSIFGFAGMGTPEAVEVGETQQPVAAALPSKGCVVVDAGHGARDAGKVGVNGELEKDINLSIALLLRDYLEANDVTVVMTRENDEPLYQETDSSKKLADMEARIATIEAADPDLVVSIHQNSYTSESVHGPQVFYYTASAEGKELAQILQARFDYCVGEQNTRGIKANSEYYLLLHTSAVINIVECGFMSNPDEVVLLASEEYQKKIAWTLCVGVLQYLNGRQSVS